MTRAIISLGDLFPNRAIADETARKVLIKIGFDDRDGPPGTMYNPQLTLKEESL
jgi:hypothetical protein